jgi:hypothetical protein
MAEDRGAFKTNRVDCDRLRQIVMFHQCRCREASRTQKRMSARPASFRLPILYATAVKRLRYPQASLIRGGERG